MARIPPRGSIVVDTNIILSAVFGAKTRFSINAVGRRCRILVSAETASEALSTALRLDRDAPRGLQDVGDLLTSLEVASPERYAAEIPAAQVVLRNAVASRNGSADDAHVLALAWAHDADIWSHDRDFAGAGWPSWSSANLVAALDSAPPAGEAQA